MLFPTTIAGSLPKPEWLAEPNRLWAPWKPTGPDLVRAILMLDVDLLWFGGIGTYVKASVESHAEVGDKVNDNVNHPAHYKVGGVETIDFIEAKKLNYNLGNVIKYVTRADHKGNLAEDLKKARWYLNREISKLDNAEK